MDQELQAMIDQFDRITDETVIAKADESDLQMFLEIHRLHKDLRHLQIRMKRTAETINAKGVMFWNAVREKYERAETAEMREMNIGLRRDPDGIPVVVEYRAKGPSIPPPLQMLFGGGDE